MMKHLIAQLIAKYPDVWDQLEDGPDLPFFLQGAALLQRGALMAGLGTFDALSHVGPGQVAALRAVIPAERLLNAAAELANTFSGDATVAIPYLLGGALGDRAGEVACWFERAPEFLTRVVGVGFEGRISRLRRLREGEPVYLLREPGNPHDPEAIIVLNSAGTPLGYFRRTLTARLAPQMDRGQRLVGEVACLLGEEYEADVRLNVRVRRVGVSGPGTGLLYEPDWDNGYVGNRRLGV